MPSLHAPTRRELLLASGTLFAWAYMPKLALAEGRDPRLLTIVLRGALDGLAVVAPVGDPNWVKLRGDKALTLGGDRRRRCRSTACSRSIRRCRTCIGSTRPAPATIVHAAATPYRERSHFDGQDVLESGLPRPGAVSTGWLNRALATLGAGGARQSARAQCVCGRADCAAGRARRRAGAVMDAAAAAARRATTP